MVQRFMLLIKSIIKSEKKLGHIFLIKFTIKSKKIKLNKLKDNLGMLKKSGTFVNNLEGDIFQKNSIIY